MAVRRWIAAGVVLLAAAVAAACSGSRSGASRADVEALAGGMLQCGDLVFRRGTGVAGRTVTALDRTGDYSHVGIAVEGAEGWMVVHAVPAEPDFKGDRDRVKCEPLERFLAPRRAAAGMVMRYRDSGTACRAAHQALRLSRDSVLFDHDYDLADTTRLYCTELVVYAFGLCGADLSEGRRTRCGLAMLGGEYIFPSDIAACADLTPVYAF